MAKESRRAAPNGGSSRAWWSETASLLVVVFVCGATLMAFEMVGSRILAPTFGSTVFVWGSLIGVFLGALSLGYLVGGRLADRRPSFFVLGTIIAAAGLIILIVPFYAPACCRWIDGASPGRSTNPLFASLFLFFVPSVLLGMVSPFAIRLAAEAVRTVGTTAGRLYALSTLGSLFGTFFTAFFLIAVIGVSSILVIRTGANGQKIRVTAPGGFEATCTTGTKVEYGKGACNIGGLSGGTYQVILDGAGIAVEIYLDGVGTATIEFRPA